MKPLELILEFTRSGREPFRLGEQEYLHRKETGRFQGASLSWGETLLSDLTELGTPEPAPATVHRLGKVLRDFLDQVGWESYEARIQEALHAKQPVFLSFQFDADELYALPWELLTLGSSGQRLAELPGLLLRYEWPDTRTAPLDPDPPKGGRILYAWSSAGGLVPSAKQGQALRQACARGGVAFEPQRDVLEHASARQLATALTSPEPVAILHLLCHGAQRGPNSLGLMLDASRPGGEPEFIDGQALASILAPHARTLRLVVLSACQSSATGAPGSTLPGVARALHQAGIQCVVASRLPLSVEGAVEMTETLYGELLGTPCSLEQALGMARDRLRRTPTRLDWASLQLYARAVDGTDTRPLALRPYRGLLAFQPEHSRFFFGREPLQEELLNRVDESHLTQRLQEASTHRRHQFQVVAGASGSGKSSLVLAGLVAHLDRRTWDVWVTRPGEAGGFAGAKSGALLSLWTGLHHQWVPREARGGAPAIGPAEVLEEAARMRQARPDRRLLLVVDQFEEVFTQLPSPEERQAYMGALWALAERRELGVIILCTLRVDYFGRCGEVAVDGAGKGLDTVVYSDEHRMFVTQLQGEQLQAIIEGPARKVGLRLDEGLVEVLRRDVGSEPGALPLLEYTLDQLWERRVGNRLTHQAYEEIGGVGGALTGAANRLLATFSPEERRVARQLLVELVDFSDDASPNTRRRGWLAQLRPSGGTEQELFDRVLARLVGSRLLVKGGEDEASAAAVGVWIEVAHESLIRRWEALTEWVRADRKAAQERRELRTLAERWRAHLAAPDKGRSFLLVGYRLEAARQLQREYGGQLAQDLHEFINESWRRAQARRRAVRLRIASLLTASVVVALIMAFLAHRSKQAEDTAEEATKNAIAQAKVARRQAQIANDLTRVAVARRRMVTDPTTSLLLLRDVEDPGSIPTWTSDVRNVLDEALSQSVLQEHKEEILWVDFSSDGKRVATGSRDGTARVWATSDKLLRTIPEGKPHDRAVVQVTFSPEDEWLVVSTEDGKASVYPLAGQAKPRAFEEELRAVAFSPDRAWVATATADGLVKLWQGLTSSEPVKVLNQQGSLIKQVAFNPKSTHVLAVSEESVQVWCLGRWNEPLPIYYGKSITAAALSPDGTHIVVTSSPMIAGNRPVAMIWQVKERTTRWRDCKQTLTHAEFSPDGQQLVFASTEDDVLRVRRLESNDCTAREFGGHTSIINRATFSPDGQWVLAASKDGTASVWSLADEDPVVPLILRGHRFGVNWAAFSQDSKQIVTGSVDTEARIWAIEKKKELFSSKLPHPDRIWRAAISPEKKYIASASNDGVIRVWAKPGRMLPELRGHKGIVFALAFSPDGRWLVSAGTDGAVRLWSISALEASRTSPPLEATATVPVPNVSLKAVAFSPTHDVMRIAVGGLDGLVRFWRLEGSGARMTLKAEKLRRPPRHDGSLRDVAFSPKGDWLVTASEDHTAIVWDAFSGERKWTLTGHKDWVRSAAMSADGQRVLTASQDGTAAVWHLLEGEGKPQPTFFNHDTPVRWAAFSPDGEHFATAAFDGLVRVWSMKDSQHPTLILRGHEHEITSVAFMDETQLVTSSIDRTVRLWNNIQLKSPSEVLEKLREKLDAATSDCLDSKEWELFIGGELPESSLKRFTECEERRERGWSQRPR